MGIVEEFERELTRRGRIQHAQWHRIDLHNHTPVSFDYRYHGPDVVAKTIEQILQKDLSVVMFTDHERLPEQQFVEAVTKGTGRLILRGVELSVFVEGFDRSESKVTNDVFYHLLVGFDPNGKHPPEYWLEEIYRHGSMVERDATSRTIKGVTCTPASLAEILASANALIIPAHLHTTKDLSSRSVDDIYNDSVFLSHARNTFTALEVVSTGTANFFDGKHQQTGNLNRTCIRSSDSHDPETLGWRHCFAQMEQPTYQELRAALELPFRVSLDEPTEPRAAILGMQITGTFFPDLWLTFSPHCNMLIAVKGSGKTSVLECLRFCLGAEIPKTRLETVNQHLTAILGPSGHVRVLIRREDGARILVQRSIVDPVFHVTFDDDRLGHFSSPDALLFPTQILGWHEIEQAATDANVRRVYMDTIANRTKVRSLEEEATAIASRIRDRHAYTSQRYVAYRDIQRQVNRLIELRKGLKELTDAALIDLRDRYQRATEQREAFNVVIERLRRLRDGGLKEIRSDLPMWADIPGGSSPLQQVLTPVREQLERLGARFEEHHTRVTDALAEALNTLEQQKAKINDAYATFLQDYDSRLSALNPEHRRLLETHTEVLEQTKSLGGLEIELAQLKSDVLALLNELTESCEHLAARLDERSALRKKAVEYLNATLSVYGVRLTLLVQQSSSDFNDLSTRYSGGARALQELRSKLPDRLAHLCLKKAYSGMSTSLNLEYGPLLFESAELGYLLSSFENDDLRIELKVGKAGEEFSPIDQLSAGQRCTAIFPILQCLDKGPLIVDQPEDNLDNRHIANSIAPALLHDKRQRQLMFTSHNANLVVLSDAECIMMFESDGRTGRVEEQGFFATSDSRIAHHVIDVLDGGDRALELRALKYGLGRNRVDR
jgi:hypothetical protein